MVVIETYIALVQRVELPDWMNVDVPFFHQGCEYSPPRFMQFWPHGSHGIVSKITWNYSIDNLEWNDEGDELEDVEFEID